MGSSTENMYTSAHGQLIRIILQKRCWLKQDTEELTWEKSPLKVQMFPVFSQHHPCATHCAMKTWVPPQLLPRSPSLAANKVYFNPVFLEHNSVRCTVLPQLYALTKTKRSSSSVFPIKKAVSLLFSSFPTVRVIFEQRVLYFLYCYETPALYGTRRSANGTSSCLWSAIPCLNIKLFIMSTVFTLT